MDGQRKEIRVALLAGAGKLLLFAQELDADN